jgi:hypothetical protein
MTQQPSNNPQTLQRPHDDPEAYPPPSASSILVFVSYGVFLLSLMGLCLFGESRYYVAVPALAYLTINIFVARTLTVSYWRHMRPMLWVPWILKAWLALSLVFMNLASIAMSGSGLDHIWLIFVFGVIPIVVIGAAAVLHRRRADRMMLISTVASLVIIVAGILCMATSSGFSPILGMVTILVGLAHFIPLSIGFIYLKAKGLYGTTPTDLPPLCRLCGHNLTGLILTYCPKCGKDIAPATKTPAQR